MNNPVFANVQPVVSQPENAVLLPLVHSVVPPADSTPVVAAAPASAPSNSSETVPWQEDWARNRERKARSRGRSKRLRRLQRKVPANVDLWQFLRKDRLGMKILRRPDILGKFPTFGSPRHRIAIYVASPTEGTDTSEYEECRRFLEARGVITLVFTIPELMADMLAVRDRILAVVNARLEVEHQARAG